MATVRRSASRRAAVDYPTSDGKPMTEPEHHWQIMVRSVQTIADHFATDPMIYVAGNLLLFYEEGNPHKYVSPDVFMVRGVPKLPGRDHYLLWAEGRGPDVIVEITSKATRREDQANKQDLYRDVLKVPEYFLFDPFEDYLDPSLQGYRQSRNGYTEIRPVLDRLPSEALGLHLERAGADLRLVDPATGQRLPTRAERVAAAQAEWDLKKAQLDLREARVKTLETRVELAETKAELAESEIQRLRLEIEALRRRPPGGA